MAESTIDDTLRDIQVSGWVWNRRRVTLELLSDGTIPVPGNYLRIDSTSNTTYREEDGVFYTVRGGNLFDMKAGSGTFASDVTLDIVELLDWDDVPQVCRTYAIMKAARRYTDQTLVDPNLARYTRQDELEAFQQLRKEELRLGNFNIFGTTGYGVTSRPKAIDQL